MIITKTQAYKNFYQYIKTSKLYPMLKSKEAKILVGVSGGSDSVFLLLSILETLKIENINIKNKLGVAHINYSLRGNDSDADQLFVENLCDKKNIKCFSKKIQIKNYANLEAKCRKIRFNFFKDLSNTHNYNVVALAHIFEDRVENLIMKLLKGGSLETMIQPKSRTLINELTYIRPLITIPKKLIMDALCSIGQSYRTDKTNFENEFFRNKIRNSILTEFDNINPNWRKSSIKLFRNLTDENLYLNKKTNKIIKKYLNNNNYLFKINLSQLFKLNKIIILRVLVNVVKILSKYNTILNQDIIRYVIKKLRKIYKNKNLSGTNIIYQNKHIMIKTVYSELLISKQNKNNIIDQKPILISVGDLVLNDTKLNIEYANYKIYCEILGYDKKENYKITYQKNMLRMFAKIDTPIKNLKLRLRQIENGDKIYIKEKQKKNVNKILGDEKIPLENRKKSFIIELDRNDCPVNNIMAIIINDNLKKSRVNYLNYVRQTNERPFIILRIDIINTQLL